MRHYLPRFRLTDPLNLAGFVIGLCISGAAYGIATAPSTGHNGLPCHAISLPITRIAPTP